MLVLIRTRPALRIEITVNSGPVGFDRRPQHPLDGATEFTNPPILYLTGDPKRMNPASMQRLVTIDIAQPRNHRLVHQQRLALPPPRKRLAKRAQGHVQRFSAQPLHRLGKLRIAAQPLHPTKTPGVAKTKLEPVLGHPQSQMIMRLHRCAHSRDVRMTGHPQGNHQPAIALKFDDHPFAPPRHTANHATDKLFAHPANAPPANHVPPKMQHATDPQPAQLIVKVSPNGFRFR